MSTPQQRGLGVGCWARGAQWAGVLGVVQTMQQQLIKGLLLQRRGQEIELYAGYSFSCRELPVLVI